MRDNITKIELQETFSKATTLRVFSEHHSFDRDLSAEVLAGEFLAIQNTIGTSDPEMILGFVKSAWGLGFQHYFSSRVDFDFQWRRADYEAGLVSGNDSIRFKLGIHAGQLLNASAFYEILKPKDLDSRVYTGFNLSLTFSL